MTIPEPKRKKSIRRQRLERAYLLASRRLGTPKEIRNEARKLVSKFEEMQNERLPDYISIKDRVYASHFESLKKKAKRLLEKKNIAISDREADDVVRMSYLLLEYCYSGGPFSFQDAVNVYQYVRSNLGESHPPSLEGAVPFFCKMIERYTGVSFSDWADERGADPVQIWVNLERRGVCQSVGNFDRTAATDFYKRVSRAGKKNNIVIQQAALELGMHYFLSKFPILSKSPGILLMSTMQREARKLKRKPTAEEMKLVRKRIPHLNSFQYPSSAIRDVRMELAGDNISKELVGAIEADPIPGGIRSEFYNWIQTDCLKTRMNRKFLAKLAVRWFGREKKVE